MDAAIASKFVKTLQVAEGQLKRPVHMIENDVKEDKPTAKKFQTGKELLYGGQGKKPNTSNLNQTKNERESEEASTTEQHNAMIYGGLAEPRLGNMNKEVTGEDKGKLRKQNKQQKQHLKATQQQGSQWTEHTGSIPYSSTPLPRTREPYRNFMCPTGRALNHPASKILRDWATFGCPTRTGRNWSTKEIWEAVERGPHRSAMSPEALNHFAEEIKEKIRTKQARLVPWDDIKDNPPPQLKISPIAAIPHKSKAFRSILDLSFRLRLKNGGILAAVNDTTIKSAPKGAINQLGECLSRIIHAFAEAEDDTKIFMAKWDIKDGFWRMDCREGEEWNFAYVLPQPEGAPTMLVVPTSLQMGWVESPPYFCAATETARDVATEYTDMPIGSIPHHKFEKYTIDGESYADLQDEGEDDKPFRSMIEVYVDDFMSLVIPISKSQLLHTAAAVMTGIHDVFPANDEDDGDDPISEKKLKKFEGQYSTIKTLLGFDFDGVNKTMWLETAKREKLLTILRGWIRTGHRGAAGIPFKEFESTIAKIRHAFTCIPMGNSLLSACNRILKVKPPFIYLNRNKRLLTSLEGCRTLLRESTKDPTRCRQLIQGWPDYIGFVDASGHGAGGVIIGEQSACTPTVFRWQWPPDIAHDIKTADNPGGRISNSDLEMAGLVLLWLTMEKVCGPLEEKRLTLFNDNSPTIGWATKLASKRSTVAEHLIQALALRAKQQKACPFTPIHIAGKRNAIADIPSRSFGSNPAWHCDTDEALLTLFNSTFPLPLQQSWTIFRLNYRAVMRVISALRMQPFVLDDWRRLPPPGKLVGEIGKPTSHLWDSIRIYNRPPLNNESGASLASPSESAQDITDEDDEYRLRQLQAQSLPLGRRYPWPSETIRQKS